MKPKNDGELTIRVLLANGVNKKTLFELIKKRKIRAHCPLCHRTHFKKYSLKNAGVWVCRHCKRLSYREDWTIKIQDLKATL